MNVKDEIRRALFLRTRGIVSQIPLDIQMDMLKKAIEHFDETTDFAVFDPNATEKRYEDDDRTVIIPYREIPKKVWVKLDDYGSVENLSLIHI